MPRKQTEERSGNSRGEEKNVTRKNTGEVSAKESNFSKNLTILDRKKEEEREEQSIFLDAPR